MTNPRTFFAISFELVKFKIVDVLFVCLKQSVAEGWSWTRSGWEERSGPVSEDKQNGIAERSEARVEFGLKIVSQFRGLDRACLPDKGTNNDQFSDGTTARNVCALRDDTNQP